MKKILCFLLVTIFISCSSDSSEDSSPRLMVTKITTNGSPLDSFNSDFTFTFEYDSSRRFKKVTVTSVHGNRWYEFSYYGNGKFKKAIVHYLPNEDEPLGGMGTFEFFYNGSAVSYWLWDDDEWDAKNFVVNENGDFNNNAFFARNFEADTTKKGAFANVRSNIYIYAMYLDFNAQDFMTHRPLVSSNRTDITGYHTEVTNTYNSEGYVVDSFVDRENTVDYSIHYEYTAF